MINTLLIFLLATSYHTVQVDGSVADYDEDEHVLTDPENDSYWGVNNELFNLYLTWDSTRLYVAVDYVVQNNAVLVLFGTGDEGIRSINNLDWYPRNFQFQKIRISHIMALWNGDLNTGGLHRILNSRSTVSVGDADLANSGYSGERGIFEAGIPWTELYPQGIQPGAVLHIVSVIAGGDHSGGGESMPDNQYLAFGSSALINTYLKVEFDKDRDGIPDNNSTINEVSSVVTYQHVPLSVLKFDLESKVYHPGEQFNVVLKISDDADVEFITFNEEGKRMHSVKYEDVTPNVLHEFSWEQGAVLHIVSVIAGGDHSGGGESMPDNQYLAFGSSALINTYLKVEFDKDRDGIPDNNSTINEVSSVVTYQHVPLSVLKFDLESKVYHPGEQFNVVLKISDDADVEFITFNEEGKRMHSVKYEDVTPNVLHEFSWEQREWPSGLYILEVLLNGVVREKRVFSVLR